MKSLQDLIQSLDQLVTVYRHLLDTVRKENEVLVAAEMKEIASINETKEKLVHKVRELDKKWQSASAALAEKLNMPQKQPTLLELSTHFSGDDRVKMEQLHSVLNLLVQRISELNKKNELMVKAALSHIAGAMNSITNTLNENPTYKKSGGMEAQNKDAQGRLVSREA